MEDTLITIIAILVSGVLLFIFPLMAVSERNNDIAESVAQKAVFDFVDEAATTGVITVQNYTKLQNTLSSTGNKFNIDIEIKKIDENIGKKSQWVSNVVVGENVQYSIYSEQITDQIMNTGAYPLRAGDTVSVKVTNSNRTVAQSFRSMLTPAGSDNVEISAQSSQVVTATGARQ